MQHPATLFITAVLAGAPLLGQTVSSDSQAMQSLLSEVRTLRDDLRTAIVAAQRIQIVLYRLQVQETAVARASQKLDEVRSQLLQSEHSKKRMADTVQQMEQQMSGTQDSSVRKTVEPQLAGFKSMLDNLGSEIPPLQAKESEALGHLQTEQAKLTELQDSLQKLDTWLESQRHPR